MNVHLQLHMSCKHLHICVYITNQFVKKMADLYMKKKTILSNYYRLVIHKYLFLVVIRLLIFFYNVFSLVI